MTIAQQVKQIITPRVSKAKLSKHLGIDRITLWRKVGNNSFTEDEIKKLKKYGVKPQKKRVNPSDC